MDCSYKTHALGSIEGALGIKQSEKKCIIVLLSTKEVARAQNSTEAWAELAETARVKCHPPLWAPVSSAVKWGMVMSTMSGSCGNYAIR